jgi:hypothetical protein
MRPEEEEEEKVLRKSQGIGSVFPGEEQAWKRPNALSFLNSC